MLTFRPRPVLCGLIAFAMLPIGCASTPTGGSSKVMTSAMQAGMTPDDVLADLEAGNRRYVAGKSTTFDWPAQVSGTASGQHPKAIVLSCLDSRVLPEAVFDQGIGDVFVGRVAGNFENVDQLGSMEFGTKVAGARLIVVLGHTSCGAVKGAIDEARLGNLTAMLQNIEPAIAATPTGDQGRTSSDTSYVDRVVEANVRQTVRDITDRSPVLADLVASGNLRVVGAVYDLNSGRVRWLEG